MDSEQKMCDDSPRPDSSLEHRLKSEGDVQESSAACVDVVTGVKDLSLTNDNTQDEADSDIEVYHPDPNLDMTKGGLDTEKAEDIEQKGLDTEKAEDTEKTGLDTETAKELTAHVQHSSQRETTSDLFSQSARCGVIANAERILKPSMGSEYEGFPETGQGSSLELYLSDFKSSSSSDLEILDMSESCIDVLLGKLDSALVDTKSPRHEQEEDFEEDNRCPSTFLVSNREDSWPMRCAVKEETSATVCTSQRDSSESGTDTASLNRKTGENDYKLMQPNHPREQTQDVEDCFTFKQERLCEENEGLHPSQDRNTDTEKKADVLEDSLGSMRKEECVFSEQTETPEKPQKGAAYSWRPTTVSGQTAITSSSQIISEEHQQALQLLGLSDCPNDSKDEIGTLSLNMISLSDESSSLGQIYTTEVSPGHRDQQETDSVSFVSDCMDENVLLRTEMESRPSTSRHDPDYVKDGYVFKIEETQSPGHSDCELDMSDGSPQHTPLPHRPIAHPLISPGDEQAQRKQGISSENSPAEAYVMSVPVENVDQKDPHLAHQEFSEDLAGNCSFTDFSFIGLPSQIAVGEDETKKENSAQSRFSPDTCESPEGTGYRPVPAPRRKKEGEAQLNMSQADVKPVENQQKSLSEKQREDYNIAAQDFITPPLVQNTSGHFKPVESQQKSLTEKQRGDSDIAVQDYITPPQVQNTSEHFSPSQNSPVDLFTIKPTLDLSPSPCKKSKESDDMGLPCYGQQNFASPALPANKSTLQGSGSQPEVPCFLEMGHAGSLIEARKQNVDSKSIRYQTDQPRQGSQLPPSTHWAQSRNTPQKCSVFQDQQRAESHEPRPSPVQTASPQSSGPCMSVPPPSQPGGQDQSMAADADIATVMVKGPSLDKHQGELCQLYFENKRSGGGDIVEGAVVWKEDQKCFLITFEESHVAKRVASKEHTLAGCPVQVQLWSPSVVEMQKDRVLVSGFLPETTIDCLQNYLEYALNLGVASVQVNGGDASALVFFEKPVEKIDVQEMEQACKENPLDKEVCLSFCGIPVASVEAPITITAPVTIKAPISTILVEGLKPETVSEAVQYFFSNKRRNAGGPVESVDRDPGTTTALVHFKNAADAESVVKKGNHVLDRQSLTVSLHDAADPTYRPGQQAAPPAAPTPAVSSSARLRPSPEQTRPMTQHQQPDATYMARNSKPLHSSSGGRGTPGNQFSSSASAQLQQGGPSYTPLQSGPPCHSYGSTANANAFPGSQAGRNPQPQANMASGEGAYRKQPSAYQPQAGPGNSALINSCSNQPKEKLDIGGGTLFSARQRSSRASEPARSTKHVHFSPPAPGFKPGIVHGNPPPKTTVIEIGADVIEKIKRDSTLLRKLIQDLQSVQGKFQWQSPDHILIQCRDEGIQDWEREVKYKVDDLVQTIRLQLHRERESVKQKPSMEANRFGTGEWGPANSSGMVDLSSPNGPSASTGRMHNSPALQNVKGLTGERGPAKRSTMMDLSSPNIPSASTGGMHDSPALQNVKDTIPTLKPAQLKILKMPKALEKLKRGFPGVEISVDEVAKSATVTGPEATVKKAFTGVLSFITNIREMKCTVSPALAQMYKKKDAVEWIQGTLIDKYGLLCDWETHDDNSIILRGQSTDLPRLEQMFKSVFQEATTPLNEEEARLLKAPAWTSFKDKMQEMKRGECPSPVLLPEETKIIIVDTPSNISQTRLALKQFLGENIFEKEMIQISPNQMKFLQHYCKEETKAVHQKARDEGISVNFTQNSIIAEGPKDSLAETVGKVRELVGRIKEDKMTFKNPGVATYLTDTKGQEFLSQTGTATGCYISTSGSGDASGDGTNSAEGQVLAKITLDPRHQVLIMQGDITQRQVNAIVNAANARLSHDGGVALAIAKAGGPSIQEESDKIAAKDFLREGDVVATGAGTLNCSHVLHAVGPTWRGGNNGEGELLMRTVRETLKKAEEMGLTSVAMPAISCGIFRFPVEQATRIIIRAVYQHFIDAGPISCLSKLILIDVGAEPLQGLLKEAKVSFGKLVEVKGHPKSSGRSSRHGGSSEHRSDRDSSSDHGYGGKSHAPIKIITGDIARSKADVIVCTLHPSLDLKKGVLSKSILEKGGDVIQQDLYKYQERHGKTELGHIVWTSGGNLDCKAVYHLSLPLWRDDHGQKMRSAVKDCLDAAIKKNARSIAFPTLGTGRLGYPGEEVASIMFSAIGEWFQRNRHSSMKEVQIVVYNRDNDSLEAFKAAEKHGGGGHSSDSYGDDRHSSGRGGRRGGDNYSGDRHSGGGRHGGDSYSSDRRSSGRGGRHGGGGHRGDRHGDSGHRGGGSNGLKTRVGKLTVMVKEGNILSEPCDAIVNSTNDNLDLKIGVLSREISKACGSDFEAKCIAQRDRMAETGVAITKVESSRLSCGNVIHISADRFKRDWQEGILSVLRAADKDGFTSVALPALGTGGRGANPTALAEAMQGAVSQFSERARCVKEVRVVVFQKQLLDPYTEAFDPGAASGGGDGSDGDTSEGYEAAPSSKKSWHGVDVYICSNLEAAIKEAREKIYRHVQHVCTSQTVTNNLIATFSHKQTEQLFKLQNKYNVEIQRDQKKSAVTVKGVDINVTKAISNMKDIMLSATTERHLAAGMPPVRWQYESGKDKFSNFDPEQVLIIEAAFKKKEREVKFSDKRGRSYKIVFKDRKEYPIDPPGHPVSVRRRDMLDEKSQEIPLPTHWEPMKGDKVKRVELKPDSNEYKRVSSHFGSQAQIKKIERIQNPTLFQQFKVKKKELEQYNPKGTENEKRLFHGTPSDSVDGIITNGFNRSYCGRHGTALGAGVYFAADSATSMGYAQGGHMFQARVLVGEYTPGNSSMRMAPNKPNSNRPYDSVSNAPQNATVFVIFHDSQAYPEYLITF